MYITYQLGGNMGSSAPLLHATTRLPWGKDNNKLAVRIHRLAECTLDRQTPSGSWTFVMLEHFLGWKKDHLDSMPRFRPPPSPRPALTHADCAAPVYPADGPRPLLSHADCAATVYPADGPRPVLTLADFAAPVYPADGPRPVLTHADCAAPVYPADGPLPALTHADS